MPHVKDLLPTQSQASQGAIANLQDSERTSLKDQPPAWLIRVEGIFEALLTHYGSARMNAHWAGLDPERAKAYWARKLKGMPSEGVSYALMHLPKNPPNIDEFLEIAGRRPQGQMALIDTAPRTEADEALKRIAEIRARFPRFKKPEPIDETQEDAA